MAKGDEITVTLPEPFHLEAIVDHLRANARFESMLAQRMGDDHPAVEAFRELAEVYLIVADAVEALIDKRNAELQAGT